MVWKIDSREKRKVKITPGEQNMNKILSLCILSFLFPLTACNSSSNKSNSSNHTNKTTNDSETIIDSSDDLQTKAQVIYFSATNHTENVANTIADYIDAPIHKLVPTNQYTSADLNYSNSDSRVVKEHQIIQNGERVNVELTTTSFEEFASANYIFLGAPVWWRQLSWVIENFVAANDFSNKTIIPFGTSASSSFDLNNLTPLTEDDENVTWLSPQRFSSSVASSSVTSWIDSLGFDFK